MAGLIRPDDEDRPFIRRWNTLVRILLIDSSIKHIARSAMDFADFDDGTRCFPSIERVGRETGYNEKTVRIAWAAMRAIGLAVRVDRGVPHLRKADEYELQIPETWASLPILGPRGRKFTCVHCGKLFNPLGNCTVTTKGGKDEITYRLGFMSFCPTPKFEVRPRGGEPFKIPECQRQWDAAEMDAGRRPWGQLGGDRWKLFFQARGDDW